MSDPQFGGRGDRQQRTEVIGQCGKRRGYARQRRAGGGLRLLRMGWVGGHEMSRNLRVMHLFWQGHRFGH